MKDLTRNQKAETPAFVRIATCMIYFSLVFGIIQIILIDTTTNEKTYNSPFYIYGALFSTVFFGYITFKIRKRKNWARIVLLLSFTLAFAFSLYDGNFFNDFDFKLSLTIGTIAVLNHLLTIAAIILLFTKRANKWFEKDNLSG